MGRATKLTPDLQIKFCNALRAGNFERVVCAAYGIDISTYDRWLKKGLDTLDPDTGKVAVRAPQPYRGFRRAIEEAMAVPEVVLVSKTYQQAMGSAVVCRNVIVITCTCGKKLKAPCGAEVQQATDGDARSREFILSRKFHERWGGRERLEHSGPGGGPIRTATKTVRFGGRYKRDGKVAGVPGDPSPGTEKQSKTETGE